MGFIENINYLTEQIKAIDLSSIAMYYTDIGTVNAVELTRDATLDVIETLFDGMVVFFTPANANTGATTLKIKTLDAKPLKYNGEDLPAGYLNTTSKYIAIYDKTNDCFNIDVITGGSAKQPFKVADAVNVDEAVNKRQLGALSTGYVDTIDDLAEVDTSLFTTIIVKEEGRGGVFTYDPLKSSINNGGTIFNGWVRQYSGAVNVKWFGAKCDGTDNTPVYDKIINSMPEGTTIEWTPETYVGSFLSNKSFKLKGNGATIIPVADYAFKFYGALGSYQDLSIAPAHNDTFLSGVTGLTEDTYVLLYSGNTRPADGQYVNYEILKVRADGTVYDKVYSDQNGGTPKYAVITPLSGITVDGFTIECDTMAAHGVFIQYGVNVKVSNIKMLGGSGSTVTLRYCHNITTHHIQRIRPSATGSGQGYNVQCWAVKYGKIYSIYDEEVRHSYDQDSSYVMSIYNVISVSCKYAAIFLAHNSFGGYTTVKDCSVSKCNGQAVLASPQGVVSPSDALFRELVVDNIKISNTIVRNTYEYYNAVQVAIPSENVAISNITVENISDTVFNYAAGTYNTGYRVVRLYDPRKNTEIKNISADVASDVILISNITNQNANIVIDTINIRYYCNVLNIDSIGNVYTGKVIISNIDAYESSTLYGNAIIYIREATNHLRQLMVSGLYKIYSFCKIIKLANNTVRCPEGKIDTSGFVKSLNSINALVDGGTITQKYYLLIGDFAIWGGNDITLSATEPIERPVTTGDTFGIFNYGSHTLTIPGGSETVDNSSDLLIEPGYLYEFQANKNGNKWKLYRKISGITLS